MWRYLAPVLIFSLIINLPKFFEVYVIQDENGEFVLTLSELRTNNLYISITKWSRLFLLGLIPFWIIIFFNAKIFLKIKNRKLNSSSTKTETEVRFCVIAHMKVSWVKYVFGPSSQLFFVVPFSVASVSRYL